MNKKLYTVVGISHVNREGKIYDILHCTGDYFYPEFTEGINVCNLYVNPNLYHIGDIVEVVYVKGSYICIS